MWPYNEGIKASKLQEQWAISQTHDHWLHQQNSGLRELILRGILNFAQAALPHPTITVSHVELFSGSGLELVNGLVILEILIHFFVDELPAEGLVHWRLNIFKLWLIELAIVWLPVCLLLPWILIEQIVKLRVIKHQLSRLLLPLALSVLALVVHKLLPQTTDFILYQLNYLVGLIPQRPLDFVLISKILRQHHIPLGNLHGWRYPSPAIIGLAGLWHNRFGRVLGASSSWLKRHPPGYLRRVQVRGVAVPELE